MTNPNLQTTKNIWPFENIDTVEKAIEILAKLKGDMWISRGQANEYKTLFAPIDRNPYVMLDRKQKLFLEQRSMNLFRTSIKYFNKGEKESLELNIPTLMLMQHHNTPTRLLDWSLSPYVSMYFACSEFNDENNLKNGELWSIDYNQYCIQAEKQWTSFRETYKKHTDTVEFDPEMPIIFTEHGPNNLWIMFSFLYGKFPRLANQEGCFSVTSLFGYDHALALQDLLEDSNYFRRYVINKEIKKTILEFLLTEFGIWYGSLFPDSTGVSDAISKAVYNRTITINDKPPL